MGRLVIQIYLQQYVAKDLTVITSQVEELWTPIITTEASKAEEVCKEGSGFLLIPVFESSLIIEVFYSIKTFLRCSVNKGNQDLIILLSHFKSQEKLSIEVVSHSLHKLVLWFEQVTKSP
jgi:hypothetical protein